MKHQRNSSTVLAILVVLLSTAGSDVSRAQRAGGGGAKLVVSVTVPPICTVAVTPGPVSAAEAIAVRCRNLPAAHPQPVVTEAMADATMIAGRRPLIFEAPAGTVDPLDPAQTIDPIGAANQVAMIVINF
jgi:hypothetical protein